MLRVLTYNIRACLGVDRVRSIDRIAEVIAAESPHIAALQEVDFHRGRSGERNQAAELARLLDLHWVAGESISDEGGGAYGNAILTKPSIEFVRHGLLPAPGASEPRSILRVRVHHEHQALDILNTHLSFRRRERARQFEAMFTDRWLDDDELADRVILCGDLNCSARDPGFRRLLTRFTDAHDAAPQRSRCTWPTRRPFRRLDHILISPALTPVSAHVATSRASAVASDHYPVVVECK